MTDIKTELVHDHPIPSEMEDGVVYLEGESLHADKLDFAFFLCPCGCKTLIALHVYSGGKEDSPSWLIESVNPLTLSPSIRQLQGCRSHFFIRKNKIEWC